MVTFGSWLEGQKNRQDPIGEMARYWLNLKGNRRIRALPSIRSELEAAGALAAGAPTAAWWEATEAAWRAYKNTPTSISGRPLSSVPDLPEGMPVQPAIMPPGAVVGPLAEPTAFAPVRGNPVLPPGLQVGGGQDPMAVIMGTLDIHSRFLAAICVRLGLSATRVSEIAAELGMVPPAGSPDPVDWNWVWDHADFDAAQGEA